MDGRRGKALIETDETAQTDFASLLGTNFLVETYQRGYRWEDRQITDLLQDLDQFEPTGSYQYYCLQPLVLFKTSRPSESIESLHQIIQGQPVAPLNGGWFELVDGQQRLTTVALILIECEPDQRYFDLYYRNGRPIDRLYFENASNVIRRWFGNDLEAKRKMAEKINKQLLFILQMEKSSAEADITFTKLNSGKIPLTSAELFKAKLLSSFKGEERAKTSMIWNQMERAMQEDGFWFFLGGDNEHYTTRMDYLLRIEAERQHVSDILDDDPLYSFHVFEKSVSIADAWNQICVDFDTLQSWYMQDDTYYYIGYLCASEKRRKAKDSFSVAKFLSSRLQESAKQSKSGFVLSLIQSIENQFEKPIDEYTHGTDEGDDNESIYCLLLLFNLLSTKQIKGAPRFDFKSFYEMGPWDLEDIHATHTDGKFSQLSFEERKDYFNSAIELLRRIGGHENAIAIMNDYVQGNDSENYGNSLDALRVALPAPRPGNTIKNLCLLDAKTNRSYGNSLFGVKREILNEKQKNGHFLLPCTMKVFLKAYTHSRNDNNDEAGTDIQALLYSNDDADDYLMEIKKVLCRNQQNEGRVCLR